MSVGPVLAWGHGVTSSSAEPPRASSDDLVDIVIVRDIWPISFTICFWKIWNTASGSGKAKFSGRCWQFGMWATDLWEWRRALLRKDSGDTEEKDATENLHDEILYKVRFQSLVVFLINLSALSWSRT